MTHQISTKQASEGKWTCVSKDFKIATFSIRAKWAAEWHKSMVHSNSCVVFLKQDQGVLCLSLLFFSSLPLPFLVLLLDVLLSQFIHTVVVGWQGSIRSQTVVQTVLFELSRPCPFCENTSVYHILHLVIFNEYIFLEKIWFKLPLDKWIQTQFQLKFKLVSIL